MSNKVFMLMASFFVRFVLNVIRKQILMLPVFLYYIAWVGIFTKETNFEFIEKIKIYLNKFAPFASIETVHPFFILFILALVLSVGEIAIKLIFKKEIRVPLLKVSGLFAVLSFLAILVTDPYVNRDIALMFGIGVLHVMSVVYVYAYIVFNKIIKKLSTTTKDIVGIIQDGQ